MDVDVAEVDGLLVEEDVREVLILRVPVRQLVADFVARVLSVPLTDARIVNVFNAVLVGVLEILLVALPEIDAVPVLEPRPLIVLLGEPVLVFDEDMELVIVCDIPGEYVRGTDLECELLPEEVRDARAEYVNEPLAVELLLLLEERDCVGLPEVVFVVVMEPEDVLVVRDEGVFADVCVSVLEGGDDGVKGILALDVLELVTLRVVISDLIDVPETFIVGVIGCVGGDVFVPVVVRVDVLECVELGVGTTPSPMSTRPYTSVPSRSVLFIQGDEATEPIDSSSVSQRILLY